MTFAFFGNDLFSKIIFSKLIENNFLPKLVITNIDKYVGRKKILTPPILKQFYLNLPSSLQEKIKLIQPLKLEKKIFLEEKYDLFIVASYPKIIPKEIIDLPIIKTIGLHPSLLPKYRCPSPIQNIILNNEKITGVTLFIVDEKVDHGPIIDYINYKIDKEDNFLKLLIKLADLGGELLIKNLSDLNLLREKISKAKIQEENFATYTKKFSLIDGFINFEDLIKAQNYDKNLAYKIFQKIKALTFEPGCWTLIKDKKYKIIKAKLVNDLLKIEIVQKESKKPQHIKKLEMLI